MSDLSDVSNSGRRGATVVITHHVRAGEEAEYEQWLDEIGPLCRRSAGHLDLQIIRPVAGLTCSYTVVIRFDNRDHLEMWMGSSTRKSLIEKVRPLLVKEDDLFIRSGLDFWYLPEVAGAQVPVRWKQFLVTWSAIFPLVLLIPVLLSPLFEWIGIRGNRYWVTLCVTGVVVFLMVYVVMPRYTRLVRRWLFR